MATTKDFRALALAEDGAIEASHFGKPDFRIGGKIFAGLSEDGAIGNMKLGPEVQAGLLDDGEDPVFFPAAGAWGRSGWTHVRLAGASAGLLRELLAEAAKSVRKTAARTSTKTAARTSTKTAARTSTKTAARTSTKTAARARSTER